MYVTEANGIAYARVEHNIAVEKNRQQNYNKFL